MWFLFYNLHLWQGEFHFFLLWRKVYSPSRSTWLCSSRRHGDKEIGFYVLHEVEVILFLALCCIMHIWCLFFEMVMWEWMTNKWSRAWKIKMKKITKNKDYIDPPPPHHPPLPFGDTGDHLCAVCLRAEVFKCLLKHSLRLTCLINACFWSRLHTWRHMAVSRVLF